MCFLLARGYGIPVKRKRLLIIVCIMLKIKKLYLIHLHLLNVIAIERGITFIHVLQKNGKTSQKMVWVPKGTNNALKVDIAPTINNYVPKRNVKPEPKRYFERKPQKQYHRHAYTWSQDRPTTYKIKSLVIRLIIHPTYPIPKFVSIS